MKAVRVAVTLLTLSASACGGTRSASLDTFAGTWTGHTRSLTIAHGRAKESIGAGCCDPVIDLELRVSQPHGGADDATATVTVLGVRVHDRSFFTKARPAPRAGQTGTLRLVRGVITESITRASYCDRPAARAGACGA